VAEARTVARALVEAVVQVTGLVLGRRRADAAQRGSQWRVGFQNSAIAADLRFQAAG
jgi:hypothetical protein